MRETHIKSNFKNTMYIKIEPHGHFVKKICLIKIQSKIHCLLNLTKVFKQIYSRKHNKDVKNRVKRM